MRSDHTARRAIFHAGASFLSATETATAGFSLPGLGRTALSGLPARMWVRDGFETTMAHGVRLVNNRPAGDARRRLDQNKSQNSDDAMRHMR